MVAGKTSVAVWFVCSRPTCKTAVFLPQYTVQILDLDVKQQTFFFSTLFKFRQVTSILRDFVIFAYHVAKKSATTSLVPAFINSGLNWVSSVSTLTLVMTMINS